MSLLGKILAVLNLLGVVGLSFLIGLDNLKREQWSRAVFMHDLAVDGIPLDDQDRDALGKLRVRAMNESVTKELFPKDPVKTQAAEVERVKGVLTRKTEEASEPAKRAALLARVLLPFAETFQDRDRLLTVRTQLSLDPINERLRGQVRQALADALADTKPGGKPFDQLFRDKMQAISPGPSKDLLARAFLADLTPGATADDRAKALDEAVQAALKVPDDGSPLTATRRVVALIGAARKKGDDAAALDKDAAEKRLTELLGEVYLEAANDLMRVQLALGVRPALESLRNPNWKPGDPADNFFSPFFVGDEAATMDAAAKEARRQSKFAAAYLRALDEMQGEPKGPFAEKLVGKGFVGGKGYADAFAAAAAADWSVVSDPEVAEDKSPETAFVRTLMGDDAKKVKELVDAAYQPALAALLVDLSGQLDDEFKATTDPQSSALLRRKAVARVLLTLADVLPALEGAPPPTTEGALSPSLQRALIVVGLDGSGAELNREGEALRRLALATEADGIRADRTRFAAVQQAAIGEALERARQLDLVEGEKDRAESDAKAKQAVLERQKVEVEAYKADLAKASDRTAVALKELEAMSAGLYDIRLKMRDATRLNQEYEYTIRYLEGRRR